MIKRETTVQDRSVQPPARQRTARVAGEASEGADEHPLSRGGGETIRYSNEGYMRALSQM